MKERLKVLEKMKNELKMYKEYLLHIKEVIESKEKDKVLIKKIWFIRSKIVYE